MWEILWKFTLWSNKYIKGNLEGDMYEKELERLKNLYVDRVFDPPFYKSRIEGMHVFDNYEKFRKIPFMYKDEIRHTKIMDRTSSNKDEIYGLFSSSGTTGNPTYYVFSKKDKKIHEKFVKFFFEELGIAENDLGAVLAPVGTDVMSHTMMWQFTTMGAGYINCPKPTPESIYELVMEVPITVIATRPSVAMSVAENDEVRHSKVSKLLLGGGLLSESRRKIIEKTWDAQCYNLLGTSELFGPMAGECREKNGLHYLNDDILIEVINPASGELVDDGGYGVAVYTTLWNKGFPLLRYWTDDIIKIKTSPCRCGREEPRIYHYGRRTELYDNGKFYVPLAKVEDILFANDFIGEYKFVVKADCIDVLVESIHDCAEDAIVTENLSGLFKKKVHIKRVGKGEIAYDGHSSRYIYENGIRNVNFNRSGKILFE